MANNENLDHEFRSKANDIKVTPSEQVWDQIDQQLSKKKRNSVYSIVGIAASLFILVGVTFMFQLQSGEYENKNYQVEQFESLDNETYQTALLEWISFNHS